MKLYVDPIEYARCAVNGLPLPTLAVPASRAPLTYMRWTHEMRETVRAEYPVVKNREERRKLARRLGVTETALTVMAKKLGCRVRGPFGRAA